MTLYVQGMYLDPSLPAPGSSFVPVGDPVEGLRIGALAPERRHDLARLGGRALFVGFVATLLNAAVAGILL